MSTPARYLKPEVLARLGRLELRARQVVEGFLSGMHRSPYHGFSVEFAAHREYVPGDDTRHIDWRLYARGDRLYVKQYEEETNLRTQVLLDVSASMAYGGKFEHAATAAAALIYLLMHQQDACGLVLFDSDVREQIAPTAQAAPLRAMIERIGRQPPAGGTDIKMLLARLAERLRQRGLIVLISDLLAETADVVDGLREFRARGQDVIVIHVLDRDELEFPFDGQVQFEGLEDAALRLRVDAPSLRESYLRLIGDFIRQVRAACLNSGIDYLLLSTADPIEAALAGYLAGRMRRARRK